MARKSIVVYSRDVCFYFKFNTCFVLNIWYIDFVFPLSHMMCSLLVALATDHNWSLYLALLTVTKCYPQTPYNPNYPLQFFILTSYMHNNTQYLMCGSVSTLFRTILVLYLYIMLYNKPYFVWIMVSYCTPWLMKCCVKLFSIYLLECIWPSAIALCLIGWYYDFSLFRVDNTSD